MLIFPWIRSAILCLSISQLTFAQPTNVDQKKTTFNRYVAIGGSLSAGVRSGGVYRESQASAFPTLLAAQLGVPNFKQPLFDELGTGYQVATLRNGVLTFTPVTPFLLDDTKNEIRLPKISYEVSNLAIPYLKVRTLMLPSNEKGLFPPTFEKRSYSFLNRLISSDQEGNLSYIQLVESKVKQVDFFTIELGLDDFISYYKAGGYGENIRFLTQDREGYFPEAILIDKLIAKGGVGVIANVPDVLKFPYFSFNTYKKVARNSGRPVYVEHYERNHVRPADPRDIFLPSVGVNGLVSTPSVEIRGLEAGTPLLDSEVIGYEEQVDVNEYNKIINLLGKRYNLPIVDLYAFYNSILSGKYETEDGVKIDPSFPDSNFFSADGITPTKLGQTLIANEFIKVINSFYGTNISRLSTK